MSWHTVGKKGDRQERRGSVGYQEPVGSSKDLPLPPFGIRDLQRIEERTGRG